ncbi:UPF0175 family protein [Haladaptatus sp. CMAA 1911]|uniref:UPF0175 family protein n=1 Tax=unclassified Haladaptatus TaxID=2622732 RepID=UPI0037546599
MELKLHSQSTGTVIESRPSIHSHFSVKHERNTNLHNESPTDPHTPQNKEYLATTIGLYVLGEISLGKAAERTGVTRWEMEEIL